MDRTLFEDIFRDAHVVDLDFSVWDLSVGMVVVAVEPTARPSRRLPVYAVDFQGVRRMEIEFAHHGVQLEFGHFQWNVFGADVEHVGGLLLVRLSSTKHLPVAVIACQDIEIRPLENDVLDRRFPGWNKPGSPFIRPGVEELVKEDVRRG